MRPLLLNATPSFPSLPVIISCSIQLLISACEFYTSIYTVLLLLGLHFWDKILPHARLQIINQVRQSSNLHDFLSILVLRSDMRQQCNMWELEQP